MAKRYYKVPTDKYDKMLGVTGKYLITPELQNLLDLAKRNGEAAYNKGINRPIDDNELVTAIFETNEDWCIPVYHQWQSSRQKEQRTQEKLKNSHVETLNKVSEGWTESRPNGLMVNSNSLDVIDCATAIGEWFIISGFGNFEGYETRDDAVEAYISMFRKHYQTCETNA